MKVTTSRKVVFLWVNAAVWLTLALRNVFFPGFLSMSPHGHFSTSVAVVLGVLFLDAALRARRTRPLPL
jgi:hypothetical protein